MTKTFKMTMVAIATLCMPAYAMGAGAAEVDANGDGILSVAEVQAVYPDVTTEQGICRVGAAWQLGCAALHDRGPAAPAPGLFLLNQLFTRVSEC